MVVTRERIGQRRELTYKALADPTRRHLLRLLDDAASPIEVSALAAQVGLHQNTVRDHLELLRDAGLVVKSAERRDRPGRPKMLYSSTPLEERSPSFEGYRFLAEILAGYMGANLEDPKSAAEAAGRAWGRHMIDGPEPFARLDPVQIVDRIVEALAGLGFSPEPESKDEGFRVKLHDCPFREIARVRTDVVCGVHLGILRGMAEELGGTATIDDLLPFVEPSLCLVDISTKSPDQGPKALAPVDGI